MTPIVKIGPIYVPPVVVVGGMGLIGLLWPVFAACLLEDWSRGDDD